MGQQIVLLRGINVGGHGKLPMKELCGILERLGAQNPRTYIQSGNAIIDREINAQDLAKAIQAAKGFEPQVLVLDAKTFRHIAEHTPVIEPDGKLLHIWFPACGFTFDQEKSDILRAETETITVTQSAIYLHAPNGIGRSKLAAKIESLAGVPCTARNINTVNKLLDMLENPT